MAGEVNDWRRFLTTQDDDATLDAIRLHGRTGRPLGDVRFLQRLQRRLSRRLISGNPDRPPKRRKQYTVPGIPPDQSSCSLCPPNRIKGSWLWAGAEPRPATPF